MQKFFFLIEGEIVSIRFCFCLQTICKIKKIYLPISKCNYVIWLLKKKCIFVFCQTRVQDPNEIPLNCFIHPWAILWSSVLGLCRYYLVYWPVLGKMPWDIAGWYQYKTVKWLENVLTLSGRWITDHHYTGELECNKRSGLLAGINYSMVMVSKEHNCSSVQLTVFFLYPMKKKFKSLHYYDLLRED